MTLSRSACLCLPLSASACPCLLCLLCLLHTARLKYCHGGATAVPRWSSAIASTSGAPTFASGRTWTTSPRTSATRYGGHGYGYGYGYFAASRETKPSQLQLQLALFGSQTGSPPRGAWPVTDPAAAARARPAPPSLLRLLSCRSTSPRSSRSRPSWAPAPGPPSAARSPSAVKRLFNGFLSAL